VVPSSWRSLSIDPCYDNEDLKRRKEGREIKSEIDFVDRGDFSGFGSKESGSNLIGGEKI